MILVVGGTGRLGGSIARDLLDQGKPVRVLVRPGSSYDELVAAGAEPVIGDLKDAPSLHAACAGVDALVTTATSLGRGEDDTIDSVDLVGNRNLVEAAAAQGVGHFVFTSVLGASTQSPAPFIQAKGETEARLSESGMAWTALQPDAFMDTWIPMVVGAPVLSGQPVTIVGEGRRRHSFVAMRDVAAYAVAALAHPHQDGQTLLIGGPQALTWQDIVDVFENELGYPVALRSLPSGGPVPGLPDFVAELIATLDTYDSTIDISELANTYGVTPTPVADFVGDFIAATHKQTG